MTGLPKIVLERLKAKSAAPQSTGTPPGPVSQPGGAHPDANLLAAFVEKALPERERSQVLTHLAQCADCRELVALTLPAEVKVAEPAHLPARRGWFAWPALRWGALAAALGAVAMVVVLHPSLTRRQRAISKVMRPTLQAARQAAPPPPTASPSVQPGAEAALAKGGAASFESTGEKAKPARGVVRPKDQNLAATVARAETEQQTLTLGAAARPPMTAGIANAPPVGGGQGISRSEGARAFGAMAVKSAPVRPILEPSAAPENPAGQISNEPQAPAPAVPAKTDVAATAKEVESPLAGRIAAPAAAPASRVAMDARMQAHAAGLADMASRRELKSQAAPLTPLWSISAKGQVQRSDGGEKDREEVRVDDDVTFRVIAARGREVWAGGSAGALYHSSDGGVNWKRVGLNSGGSTVTETIVGIQLRDPQHLTVSTASGQQWVTEDGGQHWRALSF